MIAAPEGFGLGASDVPPILLANSWAYACDSGDTSIRESGVDLRAR